MNERYGSRAIRALIRELETTPKPGLVDRRGNGAHLDLSFSLLEASALSLRCAFDEIAEAAKDQEPSKALREELGEIGRRGERTMLRASGGTNTHRGAIWAIGLLVAAAAMRGSRGAESIALRAGALARIGDRFAPPAASHGHVVERRFAVKGARGEAAAAFPHVLQVALPAIRAGEALPDVYLRLVATVDDTCVLHRGGRRALEAARSAARDALVAGGTTTRAGSSMILRLERTLLAHNASPGGCADVLSAALFLNDVAM